MMKAIELAIPPNLIKPLLDEKTIEKLQEDYLDKMRDNYKEWMQNLLNLESNTDWKKQENPDEDENHTFHTTVPKFIFQMVKLKDNFFLKTREIKYLTQIHEKKISFHRSMKICKLQLLFRQRLPIKCLFSVSLKLSILEKIIKLQLWIIRANISGKYHCLICLFTFEKKIWKYQ